MKETLKKSCWQVSSYCLIASYLGFLLMGKVLGRFALITLPDGTTSHDPTLWLQLSSIPLALSLLVAFLLFRRMTRRELLCSVAVAVTLSAVFSLLSLTQSFTFAWLSSMMVYWADFVCTFLHRLIPLGWLYMICTWTLPFVFVLFGKQDIA